VRRSVAAERYTWKHLVTTRRLWWGLFYAVLLWVVASLLVIESRRTPEYQPGQLVDRAKVTRVDLSWINEDLTKARRQIARERAPSVYQPNPLFFNTRQRLLALPELVAEADSVEDVAADRVEPFAMTDEMVRALKAYVADGGVSPEWSAMVEDLMSRLRLRATIRPERYRSEEFAANALGVSEVVLQPGQGEPIEVGRDLWLNLADKEALRARLSELANRFPPAIRQGIVHYFVQLDEPAYLYDAEATARLKEAAAQAVEPVRRTYNAGEVIVSAGAELTAAQVQLLQLERRQYWASLATWQRWLAWLGPGLMVLLASLGLSAAVLRIRPRIAENPMRGAALLLLLTGTLALAWLLEPLGPNMTAAAAVGSAMLAAVILAIAYDQRLAIAVSAVHVVIIGLALELSMGMFLVTAATCVVAIVQLREVRHRGTPIRAGFIAGLVAAAGVCAAGLLERNLVEGVLVAIGWEAVGGLLAAVVVGFFTLGILPIVESAFKVTTSMSLLELCDVNQPLLRKLAQTAPGTYNHSLTIAILAESAAEAIGADGLLCRVGAYYHDIGKMNKPNYFIENQGGGPNRHDKLSPAMSLLIIVGHVKDGVEMAKEYGLPQPVIHFIESHHGTTLVEYFYHAAMKQKGEEDAQPSEFEYRYPGPKPQTKEAAILMLCDTVESASRTLADPTASRIEQLVHKLAMKRLMDGQFDECVLTLQELNRIEESITKSLAGIYHGRIKYPSKEARRPAAEEPRPAQPAAS